MNAEEENIFFISDTHFNHDKILTYQDSLRPFNSIPEMNDRFIKTWNAHVGKSDHVFHLGDVGLGRPKDLTDILYALNGQIYLIKGNHEHAVLKEKQNRDRFVWIRDYYELFEESMKKKICLFHYPCRQWNKCHRGAWHLYGHLHSKLERHPWGRSMDVGVDNSYRVLGQHRPFTFWEIEQMLRDREIIDHH